MDSEKWFEREENWTRKLLHVVPSITPCNNNHCDLERELFYNATYIQNE